MTRLNLGCPLMALTLFAVLGTTALQAAPAPTTAKASAASAKSSLPTVTVQTGDAILEEYHGGDPGTRTTTIRAGEMACSAKAADSSKKHS